MELKTLKNILSPDNDWDETSEAKCGEAVREEAIKWVKELNWTFCKDGRQIFMDFFNLTDEEISNG